MKKREIARSLNVGDFYLLCHTLYVYANNPKIKTKCLIKIVKQDDECFVDHNNKKYYQCENWGVLRWQYKGDFILYELGDKDLKEYWPRIVKWNNK